MTGGPFPAFPVSGRERCFSERGDAMSRMARPANRRGGLPSMFLGGERGEPSAARPRGSPSGESVAGTARRGPSCTKVPADAGPFLCSGERAAPKRRPTPMSAFRPARPATRCAGESIRQEPGRPQGPSRTGHLPTEVTGISPPTRRGWRPHRMCQAPRHHRRRRGSRRRPCASRVRPRAGVRRTGCP